MLLINRLMPLNSWLSPLINWLILNVSQDIYMSAYILYIKSFARVGAGRTCNHADTIQKHRTGRALRSKSLLGRAPQPLAARNRCSGVPRGHLALEITAWARFFVFGNTRKRRPSVAFSHIPLELTARACSAVIGRSKSLFESVLRGARSRGSSKRRWIRQQFRVSSGIPFGIALLRTLHCFELCFVRLHRCQMRT